MATKQSSSVLVALDCFASLAMTMKSGQREGTLISIVWRHGIRAAIGLGLLLVPWLTVPTQAQAQSTATPASYDESIRSLQYYRYKRVAESGPERARELYYFKCWQCHNEFQKTAPQLKALYQRANLVTGAPVSDESVANQIKNGSLGMPSFKFELSDVDIADVVAF